MQLVTDTFGWKPKISIKEGMTRVYNKQLERIQNGE
jgi:hypothetical protein